MIRQAKVRYRLAGVFLLALILAQGCTYIYTARGAYYRVKPGDTLKGIADKHHKNLQELAEVNNIQDEKDLKAGATIFIPGATYDTLGKSLKREGEKFAFRKPSGKKNEKKKMESKIEVEHNRFSWPVDGDISSGYGMRRGRRHDGIDIRSPSGTPIKASADGEVVYSKRMRGYGNLILLKHENDFFTVYAHNSVNLVKVGAQIKEGQIIGKVGRTGRATGPHLHFEVREGSLPRNPLFFLPKSLYVGKTKINQPHSGIEGEAPSGFASGGGDTSPYNEGGAYGRAEEEGP